MSLYHSSNKHLNIRHNIFSKTANRINQPRVNKLRSQNNNGRNRQTVPYSKGVKINVEPKYNREPSKSEYSVETFLLDADSKGDRTQNLTQTLAERMRSSKSIRAELIAKSKLKKIYHEYEETLEENDSLEAVLRDEDFKKGKQSARTIRAERYAQYKLKKIWDGGAVAPAPETVATETSPTAGESGPDGPRIKLSQNSRGSRAYPEEGPGTEHYAPYEYTECVETPHLYDGDFMNSPTPEIRERATRMMAFMELGRRVSSEFDLNKNMEFFIED
eukprot:CAMPEP_0194305914 /NCGR_PEP_ID=MMETSP0171-20130528/3226_1 /TAXON_ID=218684 /ORGANISM="Corethron pennatum, Strain L29A3" /LENGTH=274 /DNA_ID=CAMNT_0039057569 /DNA_START=59 /DNA_END=880 /DNA_ORIENTATION=+